MCEDYSNREFQLTAGWQPRWDTRFSFICGDLWDVGWRGAPSLFSLIKRSSWMLQTPCPDKGSWSGPALRSPGSGQWEKDKLNREKPKPESLVCPLQ